MLNALISGKLTKPPARRISQSGTGYVTACLLAQAGKDESYIVNVVAFSDAACDALMALQAGDGVSVAGTFKPSGWIKEGGEVGVSVVANAVLTLADAKPPTKERAAATVKQRPSTRQAQKRGAPLQSDYQSFDDPIPF